MAAKDFVINRHGRLVFPSNAWPRLDFSVFTTVGQLSAAVSRDFEAKAPTASQIVAGLKSSRYPSRYEFLRDLGLHAFWVNRFAITMYDKRPTRWRDVPHDRDDVFLPLLTPWPEFERSSALMRTGIPGAPTPLGRGAGAEDLRDHVRGIRACEARCRGAAGDQADGGRVPGGPPRTRRSWCPRTSQTGRCTPATRCGCNAEAAVPELEALLRWAMVLHNQYPWASGTTRLATGDEIGDDDFVVLFYPRDDEVADFIQRVRAGGGAGPPHRVPPPPPVVRPVADYPPVEVRKKFAIMPRLESLAGVTGEYICTNEDIIRNTSWNWSPMTAAEIAAKTGIGQRTYTHQVLEELAAQAARAALDKAGRTPAEVGAVLCCTCTSQRLIPSVATWLSAELGIYQTHASADLIAACAGLPYGLLEAIRILQEIERPVLVVCADKFSDKPRQRSPHVSRMLFGDGAAAMVVGPAQGGRPGCRGRPDLRQRARQRGQRGHLAQPAIRQQPDGVRAGGQGVRQASSRSADDRRAAPAARPARGSSGSLLESIDLVVPHQANRVMVEHARAGRRGLPAGPAARFQCSAGWATYPPPASRWPSGMRSLDGVISAPMRVFTPAFGAGATAGYAVMQVDPAVVSLAEPQATGLSRAGTSAHAGGTTEDIRTGFGE